MLANILKDKNSYAKLSGIMLSIDLVTRCLDI